MSTSPAIWIGFNLAVLAVLALDLGLIRRESRAVTPAQAVAWTCVWVALSLLFCGGLWLFYARERALEFLTGYVIEYSLSVDNLFVVLLVFSHFKVAPEYRHRILFWGILGAFVMRATLIVAGSALVARFHWLLYLFGAFLLYTAWKLFRGEEDDEELDPERSAVYRLARRFLPVSEDDGGGRFFVRQHGRRLVTPVFLVLIMVEVMDLIFALDSIPAVLGVSADPFIIYTSNVCAILGLRSLFFIVASLMDKFHYLETGLSVVLAFVGLKMLLSRVVDVPVALSLGIIGAVLAISIAASIVRPPRDTQSEETPAGK